MLKHCTATAIDQTRRSRRNIVMNSECRIVEADDGLDDSIMSVDTSALNISGATSFLALNSQVRDSRRSSFSSQVGEPLSLASRTSSFTSLSNLSGGSEAAVKRSPIKIFAKCLRSDIEYKTLSVSRHTTSTEVIWMLLSKFKMKHRDPKLFYLTMDIGIISHGPSGPAGDSFTRTLVLEDDAHPAELKSCHPWGECRFTLQMRKGGLVRVHDSVLMAESKYKCLLISDTTTVNEVISILFHCYGLERIERVDRYELCEVGPEGCYEKRLDPSDCPVSVQSTWKTQNQFLLRRSSIPAFKSPSVISLSVSTIGSANSSKSSDSFMMPMDTDFSSESPIPRSMSSAGSGSSISPTGSVMSNISSSDESTTSTNVSPHPPPLPPPNFSGNRPLPVLPRPPLYTKPLVPNVCPPHMRRPSFHLNSPVTAFPLPAVPSSAPPTSAGMSFQFAGKPTSAIHECGLPTTPSPSSTLVPTESQNYPSLQEIAGSRTRVAFHHYENYFYI